MSISIHGNHFFLESNDTVYCLAIPEDGTLPVNIYWGESGIAADDYPSAEKRQKRCYSPALKERHRTLFNELPLFFGENMFECALKATFANGVRGIDFVLQSHEINGDTLRLSYKEKYEELYLTLIYKCYCDGQLISRSTEITNRSSEPVILEKFASATWQIPPEHAKRLTSMHGHWCGEWQLQHSDIPFGKTVQESRTGLSGHHYVPAFIIDDGRATETTGTVYFGTLLWSGDWKISVERDCFGHTAVTGGINEFDSTLSLAPGESFITPEFIAGRSTGGLGEMSRLMHKFQRNELLPQAWKTRPRPFLFNGWSTLTVNVNEENILHFMQRAHEIGVELFVIDDGWQQFLGDWTPDRKKFPRGLRPIVEAAAKYGIQLGLWVEIESFELASDLYKEHPEWAMSYPGRKPFTRERAAINRISVMLNLAIPEAAEYMYQSLRTLIQETGISYLKLDMNCYFTSPGTVYGDFRTRIDHTRNLYKIFERLNKEFPELLIENCASGAGRTDLAMSRYFSRINRSDNQDAMDVPYFQEGYSLFQLPFLAGGANHISDGMKNLNGNHPPMSTQAAAGMMGSFACGKNLAKATPEEMKEIAKYAAIYKSIRHITHEGEFFRLRPPSDRDGAVFMYVLENKSEALLFAFRNMAHFTEKPSAVKIHGLAPEGRYEAKSLLTELTFPVTGGAALQHIGMEIPLPQEKCAEMIHFKQID